MSPATKRCCAANARPKCAAARNVESGRGSKTSTLAYVDSAWAYDPASSSCLAPTSVARAGEGCALAELLMIASATPMAPRTWHVAVLGVQLRKVRADRLFDARIERFLAISRAA